MTSERAGIDAVDRLSPRVRECAKHVGNGMCDKEIAGVMGVSPGVVILWNKQIYKATGLTRYRFIRDWNRKRGETVAPACAPKETA